MQRPGTVGGCQNVLASSFDTRVIGANRGREGTPRAKQQCPGEDNCAKPDPRLRKFA
jgi:hypothetical protein